MLFTEHPYEQANRLSFLHNLSHSDFSKTLSYILCHSSHSQKLDAQKIVPFPIRARKRYQTQFCLALKYLF